MDEWREMLGCVVGLGLGAWVLKGFVWWISGMGEALTANDWRVDGVHPVVRAAEIAAQRHTGRECGDCITVDWQPGQALEIDAYAQFIMEHGMDVGVRLNIVGDAEKACSDGARVAARSYGR